MLVGNKVQTLGRRAQAGVTLLQVLTTVTIVGVLATLAVPSYSRYVDRARVTRAIGMLGEIEIAIKKFELANEGLPPLTLAEVGLDGRVDPWGNDYRYVNIVEGGIARTDHTSAPINTDYDLFSIGKDGETASTLTDDSSQDDIIRGTDGAFLGLVTDYSRLP